MLGKHVNESDLACLLCKAPNHISVGISPPGNSEGNMVPLRVRLGWSKVQVTTLRAINLGSL